MQHLAPYVEAADDIRVLARRGFQVKGVAARVARAAST